MERVKELFASWRSTSVDDTYLKSFKDAGYHYTVLIKFNSLLEDEVQCGISIVVNANVDEIGMDLVKYAMGHIIEEAGDQIKILEKEIELEWALISVLVTGIDYIGSILDIIGWVPTQMVSFQELNRSILNSKNTPLNLVKLREGADIKKNKLTKVLDYITQTYTAEHVQEVKYDITTELQRVDDQILPIVKIELTVLHTYPAPLNYFVSDESNEFKNHIKEDLINQIHESSPVDLSNKKNRIVFTFAKAK